MQNLVSKKNFLIALIILLILPGCFKETLFNTTKSDTEIRTEATLSDEETSEKGSPAKGTVWLFEHVDYKGERKEVSKSTKWIGQAFTDKASSFKVGPDTFVTLFVDKDYKGAYKTFGQDVKNLKAQHNFNDVVSSLFVTEKLKKTAGGKGGAAFQDLEQASRIAKIKVRSGHWIDSVQLVWELPDGSEKATPNRGGSGGGAGEFVLKEGEYLTKITGKYHKTKYVGSLVFHTNKRKSQAFGLGKGDGGGQNFELKAPKGSTIVGLHGRSGRYLDNLGVFVRPIDTLGSFNK